MTGDITTGNSLLHCNIDGLLYFTDCDYYYCGELLLWTRRRNDTTIPPTYYQYEAKWIDSKAACQVNAYHEWIQYMYGLLLEWFNSAIRGNLTTGYPIITNIEQWTGCISSHHVPIEQYQYNTKCSLDFTKCEQYKPVADPELRLGEGGQFFCFWRSIWEWGGGSVTPWIRPCKRTAHS